MIEAGTFKMLELVVFFAAVIGFCVWQLREVTRLQRDREASARDQQQQSPKERE